MQPPHCLSIAANGKLCHCHSALHLTNSFQIITWCPLPHMMMYFVILVPPPTILCQYVCFHGDSILWDAEMLTCKGKININQILLENHFPKSVQHIYILLSYLLFYKILNT